MIQAALVLEGGSLRGMFTAGVLDMFLANQMEFAYVNGVSAGSLNAMNYISKQIGRSARINTEYINDKRYAGISRFLKEGSVFSFDFLFGGEIEQRIPFDQQTFASSQQIFEAIATDMESGKGAYFRNGECEDIVQAVIASSSLPLLAHPVSIGGKKYMDGGVSVSIGYRRAIELGYDKIVVVLTREQGFRKAPISRLTQDAYRLRYHKYPEFQKALVEVPHRYNAMQEEMDELVRQGRIFVLRPGSPVTIGRVEKDVEKLADLYYEGRQEALNHMQALREYVEER